MTKAEEKRFDSVIYALAETFGVALSPGQILGYQMGLASLAMEDIESAVRRAIETLKFMPKPSELRELAGVMTTSTRAVLAWGAVKKAVHQVSAYGSPDFDDPVINATIRNMGGWVRLCGSSAAEFDTWVRKDFERIYAHLALSQDALSASATSPLMGIHGEGPKKIATGLPPLPGHAPAALAAAPGGES